MNLLTCDVWDYAVSLCGDMEAEEFHKLACRTLGTIPLPTLSRGSSPPVVRTFTSSLSLVCLILASLSTHSRSLALCRSCLRWSVAKRELLSMTPRTARRSLVQKWIHESRYLEHVPILESESSRSCCVVLRLICSVRRCEAGIEVGDGVLP